MNRLATIFGTAASGKDTLLAQLDTDPYYKRVVNTTTRSPRHGEEIGKEYHFISSEQHDSYIDEGYYLTYAYAHGRYYGVLKTEVELAWIKDQLPIGHFGVADHIALWKEHDESRLAVASMALFPPDFDSWRSRMHSRLESRAIGQDEYFDRARSAISEIAFSLENKDRFTFIYSCGIDTMRQQVDGYLRNGKEITSDFTRINRFGSQLLEFLQKHGEV